MKIPRDVPASDLVKALRVLGYQVVRQDGSHIRLTTELDGKHHVTIPNHKTIAAHHNLTVEVLVEKLGL